MLGFLLLIVVPIIAIFVYSKMSQKENGAFKFFVGLIGCTFLVIIGLIVYAVNAPDPTASPSTVAYTRQAFQPKPTATPFNAVSYYQDNYPMVWGYVRKNASNPASYIQYYHRVWGDLQEYTGDGINFDTLTRYEQSLVNYPRIGTYVYFATSSSSTYHSTNMCYSLLKSDPISRPASQRYKYNPCSKCVED